MLSLTAIAGCAAVTTLATLAAYAAITALLTLSTGATGTALAAFTTLLPIAANSCDRQFVGHYHITRSNIM